MDKEAQGQAINHHAGFDYSLDLHHPQSSNRQQQQEAGSSESGAEMVDYRFSNPAPQPQVLLDKLSFAEVMQFADFGPKLALNQARISEDENYFLKFHQVLGDKLQEDSLAAPPALPAPPLPPPPPLASGEDQFAAGTSLGSKGMVMGEEGEEEGRFSEDASSVQQRNICGVETRIGGHAVEVKNRRKRPRSLKTSEEVESQRMTHIAVERNRRRQMNEHLRVLRSLMPGSYVQRGDQASIIGGAIEFVRELEQLLQCLESQKRRRLFGNSEPPPRAMVDGPPPIPIQHSHQQPFYPSLPYPDDTDGSSGGGGLQEEMAENKSCLADVEVRLLGCDAMIKILSRRRPGQLLKIITALEDLQFIILHTNITTIEQTVLYSFNVKITGETRCTAEGIAGSVQQILSFIDANTL